MKRDEWICDEEVATFSVGHVTAVSSQRRKKKKHPIGFAAPTTRRKRMSGGREAGTFPEVGHL